MSLTLNHTVWATATVLLGTFLLACEPDAHSFSQTATDNSMSEQEVPYYYLELSVLDARTVTTVNGVGVDESDGRTSASFNSPMNALLIGTENTVTVTVRPTMVAAGDPPKSGKLADADSVRSSTVEEAKVTAKIKKITSGTVTPESGTTLVEKSLQEVVEKREEALRKQFLEKLEEAPPEEKKALADQEEELTSVEFPIEMELTFDSEDVPSFRDRFMEAPVIEDTSALKDFAMYARDLLDKKKIKEFFSPFSSKYEIYRTAYPSRRKEDRFEWFRKMMEEHVYPKGILIDFEREDIELRRWAGGRVWEINVDRGEGVSDEFILTGPGEKGRAFMDIFVGKVDGELKVVR
ncbi:hypothetical protein BSZ35_07080 [Salinibacter sp. 10B]|uniref:hypothetical protein n=1 Tax=Salinibacter sp. 10B TaxID=1923971 RepID=UPI000CF57345|nr:hypothetical protein [Salinibacter sp. 10B]PQJ34395.1 hypothetical protein BSZ35_07080 [Salinibacter sp. 10B]